MLNVNVSESAVKANIKRYGKIFTFKRKNKNEYGEFIENDTAYEIFGLYHESNSYIELNISDSGKVQSKKKPMILYCQNDYEETDIVPKIDDIVEINGRIFKVTGTVNVSELNIFKDISLEVQDVY